MIGLDPPGSARASAICDEKPPCGGGLVVGGDPLWMTSRERDRCLSVAHICAFFSFFFPFSKKARPSSAPATGMKSRTSFVLTFRLLASPRPLPVSLSPALPCSPSPSRRLTLLTGERVQCREPELFLGQVPTANKRHLKAMREGKTKSAKSEISLRPSVRSRRACRVPVWRLCVVSACLF